MDGTNFQFNQGARVRLRDHIDPSFYNGLSVLGNEGWVQARRKDRFNLPEIYIVWDPNHWAYNGAPNRWTFEDHFDLVEDSLMASKKEIAQEAAASFANTIASLFADTGDAAPNANPELDALRQRAQQAQQALAAAESGDSGDDADLRFTHAVDAATEKLASSEAFIIVGVDREEHPQSAQGILVPFALGYSRTPEGEILVQSQIAFVAARAHQDLAIKMISGLRDEVEE